MTPKQLAAITKHGNNLNAIFNTGLDPVTLCKKLRRIESAAHKLAEDACNFLSMESPEFEQRERRIKVRLAGLLALTWTGCENIGIFVNYDPRGYALKINNNEMIENKFTLYQDWGGYGILAPEFDKEGR